MVDFSKIKERMDERLRKKALGVRLNMNKDMVLTDATYWYPLICGYVPTPKTKLIWTDTDLFDLGQFLDEIDIPPNILGEYGTLLQTIHEHSSRFVNSDNLFFLRTAWTSGKHSWKNTCLCPSDFKEIGKKVLNLVEDSLMKDLPTNRWMIRELLPVTPVFIAKSFADMPIVKELRVFIEDGVVDYSIPYWPLKAFVDEKKEKTIAKELENMYPEYYSEGDATRFNLIWGCGQLPKEVSEGSIEIAQIMLQNGEPMSVDWMLTDQGWYCIDMAWAKTSWGYIRSGLGV